ncbi:PEP-CTERM sorting domain-containing protein [Desulfobacula phenolica]
MDNQLAPEPGIMLLFSFGFLGLAGVSRRKK